MTHIVNGFHKSENCFNEEVDSFDYDELLALVKEIDKLLDRVGFEDEEEHQQKVRDRVKGISIDLGIHRDFLAEYRH
jgi:hypothetical protein